MDEKSGLPPYSAVVASPRETGNLRFRGPHGIRRRRALKFLALACLALIAVAQWKQVWHTSSRAPKLSLQKLGDDLATCKKLRHKPQDPVGLGRDRSARYIEGGKPTLIKNATIWIGEPVEGTSEADARAGKGWEWVHGDVLLERGLIQKVEAHISSASLPKGTIIYDAAGRLLTSGIIDMHSHTGDSPTPGLQGTEDGNEMSDNITPWARSIDAIHPFDPQIQVIKSGGVTTSLVLPGSSNNIGGEAYLIKHAVGKPDGRLEISATDMLADPERNWRYMKMACGENPKRVYGLMGNRGPFSRMGESYEFRRAFEKAREVAQKQDDWCDKAKAVGVENMDEYLPQQIQWESLGAAMRGQVHINVHCYTVPDLEAMVDHTNEFKFAVRAFHHAHQTYLVPEILKRTWGGRAPSSALFADNMYYKTESYVGSEFAGKYLYDAGLTPVYVSDNPVLNAQHVLFEAAKGYHYGLPYHAALASVTTAPADELGMGQRLGKVKPGFDADVVVWDSDPLSVGATPVQVWIDGTAQFERPVELLKTQQGPLVPDESLAHIVEEPSHFPEALFTGVTKVLLSDDETYDKPDGKSFNVAVSKGEITCIGACESEFAAATAAGVETFALRNGHLTRSFTGVAGTLGLNHIDAEMTTDNGPNPFKFTRALDGLQLGGKKLHAGANYGVTRAISAPTQFGGQTHHGTSVGFVTTARTSLEKGAVFAPDAAVHYTLDVNVRNVDSYSGAFGELRKKLLDAAKAKAEAKAAEPFSEAAYLREVVAGAKVLALTINGADGIATALRIKEDVESVLKSSSSSSSSSSPKLKLAIVGGAESHLVARELAAASVGVILLPMQSTGLSWDSRRAPPGAPLTNGTAVDRLVDAGVTVGVGLHEDWRVRTLGFEAGTAYRNGNGRFSEKRALDLVSTNIHKILGVEVAEAEDRGHFIVSEGNPLEIGSRIKAVGTGSGMMYVFV